MEAIGILFLVALLFTVFGLWGAAIWNGVNRAVTSGGAAGRRLVAAGRRYLPGLRRRLILFVVMEAVLFLVCLVIMDISIRSSWPMARGVKLLHDSVPITVGGVIFAINLVLISLGAQVLAWAAEQLADASHGIAHFLWSLLVRFFAAFGLAEKLRARQRIVGWRQRAWTLVAFPTTIWLMYVLCHLVWPHNMTKWVAMPVGLVLWALYYARTYEGLRPLFMRMTIWLAPTLLVLWTLRVAAPEVAAAPFVGVKRASAWVECSWSNPGAPRCLALRKQREEDERQAKAKAEAEAERQLEEAAEAAAALAGRWSATPVADQLTDGARTVITAGPAAD